MLPLCGRQHGVGAVERDRRLEEQLGRRARRTHVQDLGESGDLGLLAPAEGRVRGEHDRQPMELVVALYAPEQLHASIGGTVKEDQ